MFLFPSLFLPLSLSHSLYLSLSLNQASQYEMEKCLKKQKNSQRWEILMPFVRWLSSKNEAELYLCRLSELLNLNMKFLVCYIPSLFLSLVCFSFFFSFSLAIEEIPDGYHRKETLQKRIIILKT